MRNVCVATTTSLVTHEMNSLFAYKGRGRKGVSPLIAAVLLIAFTMAVAAILTAWVTTFTQETTQEVGNISDELIECSYAGVSVYAASWTGNSVDVTVINTGNVDLRNVSVYAFDGASIAGQSHVTGLGVGSVAEAEITEVDSMPDTIRLSSTRCPDTTAEETHISDDS